MTTWLVRPARWLVPGAYASWLETPGSLTTRLRAVSTSFRVLRLAEGWGRAHRDERDALAIAADEPVWLREVLLLCDEEPVVFAHSIVAAAELNGPWRSLRRQGSRPLGDSLFAGGHRHAVARSPLSFARLAPNHPLHRGAVRALGQPLPAMWARRGVYRRTGTPLVVTELFLPAVLSLTDVRAPSTELPSDTPTPRIDMP
ncbi:MAG: chorismate lyase [Rhodocyclaceae bacterium]|nr:chorismate lyase [Rhodocyclaceae bacterium]